jgi:MOSC domain-containing protein YiiM
LEKGTTKHEKTTLGMFGENLATEDLFEDQVNIGDVF